MWTESLWTHSVSAWRQSQCGWNLCGPFLRATVLATVRSCTQTMVDNGKGKGPRTSPSEWVSVQLLYIEWVPTANWQCGQNLDRPFLQAVRFHCLFYITLWNTIFPYQDCNNTLPLAKCLCSWDQEKLDLKIIVISTCNELTEAAKCFGKQWRALICDKGVVSSNITQATCITRISLSCSTGGPFHEWCIYGLGHSL